MSRLPRAILAVVFGASAVSKAVSLGGTGALIAVNLGVGQRLGALLVAGLIVAEAGVATLLVIAPSRGLYRVVLALTGAFLLATLVGLVLGWQDCGCFGTVLALSPTQTVAKNVVLLVLASMGVRLQRRKELDVAT